MRTYKCCVGIKIDNGFGAKYVTVNNQLMMIQFSNGGTDTHVDMALNNIGNQPICKEVMAQFAGEYTVIRP